MVGIFYPLINSFAEPASQSIPFFTNYVIPTGMIDIDYVLGADNNSDISTKITRLFQKKDNGLYITQHTGLKDKLGKDVGPIVQRKYRWTGNLLCQVESIPLNVGAAYLDQYTKSFGNEIKTICPYIKEGTIGTSWVDPANNIYKIIGFKKINSFSFTILETGVKPKVVDEFIALVIEKTAPIDLKELETLNLSTENKQFYINAQNKYGGLRTVDYFFENIGFVATADPATGQILEKVTQVRLISSQKSSSKANSTLALPGWSYVNEFLLCDKRQTSSRDECYKLIQDLKNFLPNPWHIYGDFNGDKINDEAGLLINQKGERRLYAFLGKLQGAPEAILLHDVGKLGDVDLYVALVEPGSSGTYCADSPDECEADEPKTIDTKNPRIAFGLFEATQTDFYWDDKTKKFESVSISD